MKPKEKAKELVNAMGISVSYGINYTGGDDIPMHTNQYAKECALICCNEVLGYMGSDRGTEFWLEVKQEIEKL